MNTEVTAAPAIYP